MKQQVRSCGFECIARQEKSEVAFERVKEYCSNVEMDFKIKINWAEEANQHYSVLLNDFSQFKESTGKAMLELIQQQQDKLVTFDEIQKNNVEKVARIEFMMAEL